MRNQLNAAQFIIIVEHMLLDAKAPAWMQNIIKLFYAECAVPARVQKRLHNYRLFGVWQR